MNDGSATDCHRVGTAEVLVGPDRVLVPAVVAVLLVALRVTQRRTAAAGHHERVDLARA